MAVAPFLSRTHAAPMEQAGSTRTVTAETDGDTVGHFNARILWEAIATAKIRYQSDLEWSPVGVQYHPSVTEQLRNQIAQDLIRQRIRAGFGLPNTGRYGMPVTERPERPQRGALQFDLPQLPSGEQVASWWRNTRAYQAGRQLASLFGRLHGAVEPHTALAATNAPIVQAGGDDTERPAIVGIVSPSTATPDLAPQTYTEYRRLDSGRPRGIGLDDAGAVTPFAKLMPRLDSALAALQADGPQLPAAKPGKPSVPTGSETEMHYSDDVRSPFLIADAPDRLNGDWGQIDDLMDELRKPQE